MSDTIDRRSVLKALAASTMFGLIAGRDTKALAAQNGLQFGKPAAFSFDTLKETARRLAATPYVERASLVPNIPAEIDYETWGKIIFNTDYALFSDGRFPVTFFHLGKYFQKPVAMHVVEGGAAREIVYDQRYFDMPADSIARQLPKGVGFAGFRIQEPRDGKLDWHKNDWVAFLGASYFRAIGELYQYGLSARGVAIDTVAAGRQEEFPDFTNFYIEKTGPDAAAITVHALLDGPSVAGACKFVLARGKGVTMDIEQALFLRKDVSRFGIAPLTSMYWFSETAKPTAVDWRPEVHDSDGLAMWTGWGEHLWRPLNNPPHIMASAFGDENPKGFGLLQRDRVFDHYLDGVYYEKRPSLWVEPKGNWGKGAIQLIEIPTDDEIRDNITAMWVPEKPAAAGSEFNLAYKLHWLADEPYPTELARCVATRLGDGGQPGQPRPKGVRKFLVEFLGGPLADLPFGAKPDMVLQASRGQFTDYKIMEAVSDGVTGHWRAQFDLAGIEGTDPVEMRLQLAVSGKIVSETWMFQYHPF
ncbi:MAG TPA: glucan biosynthesis protein D [Micropepsaceae bacterium]|nr:glucan biosynthesis protein D [Micropepsaceae bacterium]